MMLPCDCGHGDDVHLQKLISVCLFGICTIYFWGPLVFMSFSELCFLHMRTEIPFIIAIVRDHTK